MNLLSLLFSQPIVFFAFVLLFLFSLSIHEASHALASTLLGDMTAKRSNRLTLNPMAHVDMLGFLALITIGFGWGKPVPFNPYQLKYPRWGPVIVAGAGPLSNLILGTVFALLFRIAYPALGSMNLLTIFLSSGAFLNFALMFFNFIPIPPLDGSKALLAVLDEWKYRDLHHIVSTQGPMLLLGLVALSILTPIDVFSWLGHASQWLFLLIARV